jgi:hypothetical protein
MRLTQFMLPAKWIPLAHQAAGGRGAEAFRQIMEQAGLPFQEAEPVIRSTLELLAEQDLTVSEIKKALGIQSGPIAGAFGFLISMLCRQARLVWARVKGSWKSNLYTYTRFERWLPDVDLDSVSPEDARRELARLYLAGYGPARPADLPWWAGLSQGEASEALEELGGSILRLQVDLEGPYYMLKSDSGHLLEVPNQPPWGVAVLPLWDAYLMAYADRSMFVPDAWHDRVYDGGGNATSTVLVDGRAAGVWAFELRRGRLEIRVGYFHDPPPKAREASEAQGRRLAGQIGARDLAILAARRRRRWARPPGAGFRPH